MQVAFIGGGNMADAILTGLTDSRVLTPDDVIVSDPSTDQLEYLSRKHQVRTTPSNTEAISGCDIIFVAVKPHFVAKVFL